MSKEETRVGGETRTAGGIIANEMIEKGPKDHTSHPSHVAEVVTWR